MHHIFNLHEQHWQAGGSCKDCICCALDSAVCSKVEHRDLRLETALLAALLAQSASVRVLCRYLNKRARTCYWFKLLSEFSKLLTYK